MKKFPRGRHRYKSSSPRTSETSGVQVAHQNEESGGVEAAMKVPIASVSKNLHTQSSRGSRTSGGAAEAAITEWHFHGGNPESPQLLKGTTQTKSHTPLPVTRNFPKAQMPT
jgi:hypothetical protein